ncbi:RNA methyltransferase [Treponema pedis]|uniref:RNA methyltransferase n=1 Tax=Treponema pedis TaxID=409322 RepID=UPI0003F8177B|nr:RNA methyltransferase [Treponema pedis]
MSFKTVIILCRPETSMNIGAVCRVMANTGLSELRITGNKTDYNETEVLKLALQADYIWKKTKFFPPTADGLKEAGADCSALAGTTRRTGQKRKTRGITPEELCGNIEKFYGTSLGIVFGNERTGLTDEELNQCTFAINIPAEKNFGSYNLSHAVLILAYSLYSSQKNYRRTEIPVEQKSNLKKIRETSKKICSYLTDLGMFKTGGKNENEAFFTKLLSSAGASEFDTEHLEGIFKKIFYIKNNSEDKGV